MRIIGSAHIFLLFLLFGIALSAYNESMAKLSAYYSAVSNCPQESIEKWSCTLCQTIPRLQQIQYINSSVSKVNGFVGFSPVEGKIFVVFKGAADIESWFLQLFGDLVPYPRCKNCKVHREFLFAYQTISQQLINSIDKLQKKYPNAKTITMGHSLGGVLASFAALELQIVYNKVSGLYALGCPRFGQENFAQFFSLKVKDRFRAIHNRDIVPHYPTRDQGYHHFGQQVFYDQQFIFSKICDQSGEDPNCSNQFDRFDLQNHFTYWIKINKSVC